MTDPKLILGSASPRRREILHDAGFDFEVIPSDAEEVIDPQYSPEEAVKELALQKLKPLSINYPGDWIITSDTVVSKGNKILGKPADFDEAKYMLQMLSGTTHSVFSSICLSNGEVREVVAGKTRVYMRTLEEWEIAYYIQNYEPYDKAGAYGIQEWIGMVGIEKIEGSYFTVMGLPVHLLYSLLLKHTGNSFLR